MESFFKSRTQEVLFIGATLMAFIAFYVETDIYTPSFPEMVTYFRTNEDAIQRLLSMNFLGLCVSSLFFGPASDAYGRRKILCLGLAIFMLGSIGCALTSSFEWMIGWRFFQGIGCGSIVSAGMATFFDIYPPESSSRLVSFCNGAVGGMMALAPLIGNWISIHYGWRTNFYVIALLATLAFVSVYLFIKETLPKEKRTPLNLANIVKNYTSVLTNFPFLAHTLIWSLMFSVVIVFIANLSLIFIDYLHVPHEAFGFYQTAIMGAFFIGSMSGTYIIKAQGLFFTKWAGNACYLLGFVLLTYLSYAQDPSPLLLIISMSLVSFGSALSMTIYFSYSMSYIAENLKGSAMSITQSFRLLLTSGLVGIAASQFDGTTRPMCVLAGLCTVTCIALYGTLYRRNLHKVVTL